MSKLSMIKARLHQLNSVQKFIISVIWCILLFIICFTWASNVGKQFRENWTAPKGYYDRNMVHPIDDAPFDLTDTWWIWSLYFVFVGLFLVILYSTKSQVSR